MVKMLPFEFTEIQFDGITEYDVVYEYVIGYPHESVISEAVTVAETAADVALLAKLTGTETVRPLEWHLTLT
jgi:hypothetical protein